MNDGLRSWGGTWSGEDGHGMRDYEMRWINVYDTLAFIFFCLSCLYSKPEWDINQQVYLNFDVSYTIGTWRDNPYASPYPLLFIIHHSSFLLPPFLSPSVLRFQINITKSESLLPKLSLWISHKSQSSKSLFILKLGPILVEEPASPPSYQPSSTSHFLLARIDFPNTLCHPWKCIPDIHPRTRRRVRR